MPTPLLSSTSPDFVDLRFDVELLAPTRPDTFRARLSAHHDGHDVGFLLEVATDLEPGLLPGGEVARAVEPLRPPCRLKLFHDDPLGRGDYAEVFLDLAGGGVAIEEKDSDYRPYWVRAWSVSPVPWSRVTLLLDPGPTLAQVEPDDIRRALEALGQTARRAVLADGDDAERVALAWAADRTLLGQGWQGVAWEQVSGVFGPTP